VQKERRDDRAFFDERLDLTRVLLSGLARRKARGFDTESLAAGRSKRKQESQCKDLPRGRDAHLQHRGIEIIGKRRRHLVAAAAPKEAGFEQRGEKT
jgi:hypothetical protein